MRTRLLIISLVLIVVLACAAIHGLREYADRRNCVCSMLMTTEKAFTIDDRFYRVCEKDTLSSGTFMIVRTTCDHDEQLHLTVYPDEGIFKGYIPNN